MFDRSGRNIELERDLDLSTVFPKVEYAVDMHCRGYETKKKYLASPPTDTSDFLVSGHSNLASAI